MRKRKALWHCPDCGEGFTTTRQWHSCGAFDLEATLAVCEPSTRELFDAFRALVEELGGVKVIPQKTRVAFQVRMRFAAIFPRKKFLRGHIVLERHYEARCIEKIESFSARNHVHHFRLDSMQQLTGEPSSELRGLLRAAHAVGCQEHLT